MKHTAQLIAISSALALAAFIHSPARAAAATCTSTNVTENFTGATTNCTWNWIGGACLTAATAASTTSPGPLPQCVGSTYYGNQTQLGGNSSPTGNLNTTPDTVTTGGALRLTNSANSQAGAIISNVPFDLSANGVQISFTTETYEGDSGGANHDGADGISFFLQDASAANGAVTVGDWGGSLGYTCSNTNNSTSQGYDGMIGAYIGLGIDEYGNFLNGTTITNADGTTSQSTGADNTSSGYGYVPNRIGLRGAGSTAWSWLNTNSATAAYYPSTLNSNQKRAAVRQACQTGYVWDYSNANNNGNGGNTNGFPNPYGATPVSPQISLANYAAIPNAYKVLTAHKIANESALYRGYGGNGSTGLYGVPITYNLSITPGGLLSLAYSYDNGNFQPIITGQQIPVANGALPAQVRFGFAGSTGGSRNVHEIMCFQAQPQNSASSSAGLNQKQTAKVQTGTQVYFAFYNANNWTGDLTSQYLDTPANGTANDLQIDPAVNWSASCNLTLIPAGQTCAKTGVAGPNSPQDPDSGRVVLSWNGSAGIGFKYANLSSTEQTNMNYGDAAYSASSTSSGPPTTARVEYLRGVRSEEQTPQGVDPSTPLTNPSGFRARTSVLGDIVDSSPTWVGPPSVSFPTTWSDFLHPSATMLENAATSTHTYSSFKSTYATRTNVVYAGANDGLLHGFRTGKFNADGTYAGTTTAGVFTGTNNDGKEVLAYMPGYVVNTINSATLANTLPTTPNPVNDYTNPLYAHKFNVDGTPGTGDIFYGGQWHSWLVGGLGAGGSAIYALDITDPDNAFSESNAANVVIGEWQSALTTTTTTTAGVTTTTVTGATTNITCPTDSTTLHCGYSLGKTFGTPQIRRFHNDATLSGRPNTSWGVVFGNGSGSYNGDAGIYIMMVNTSSTGLAAPTFYYLSTGVGSRTGTPNAIYSVAPADLDGDHVTDYVYAGDLQGNVWRFDLTDSDPANWAVMKISGVATPIYTTPGGSSQPITTAVIVATVSAPTARVVVEFGTGQQIPFTNNSAAIYSTAQQYLMGVWDWNMTTWNSLSSQQLASLSTGSITAGTGCPTGAIAVICGVSQLQAQTFSTYNASGTASSASSTSATNGYYRTVSNTTVCWADTTACTGSAARYGWYLALTSGSANINDPSYPVTPLTPPVPTVYEQVIFNPTLQLGAFIVNTTIPPTTNLAQCSSTLPGGWTMAIDPATGGAFTNSVFADSNHNFLNIGNQAVSGIALSGTGSPSVVTAGVNTYIVTQTTNGTGTIQQANLPGANSGKRVTWIEKR